MKTRFLVAVAACASAVSWHGSATPRALGSDQPRNPATGPLATKATVIVKSNGKPLSLKREEQIAFTFLSAIASLEQDCRHSAAEPCTLEALVRRPRSRPNSLRVGKLKFDPTTTDPNYTYKIVLAEDSWQIWANPRKPGLGGFYDKGPFDEAWYNAAGPATEKDKKIDEFSIDGDNFGE